MRRFVSNNLVRPLFVLSLAVLLLAGSVPVLAQSPGYDLFQTGSGSAVNLPNIGSVQLQGVAIQSSTGNTDTMIQRTSSVPQGGGNVNISMYALFMKSTQPVNLNGTSADVYVTLNNTGGTISTSVIPQPDTNLSPSTGSLTVRTDGTFDSSINVNADVIFVRAGQSVTNSANWLGHQAAPSVTMSSTNSTWSTSAPSGYPAPSGFPSGGFYPIKINGHLIPPHVHPMVVAQCGGVATAAKTNLGNQAAVPIRTCVAVAQ
jgi:hypothetical protein